MAEPLPVPEARALLSSLGVPLPRAQLASTRDGAIAAGLDIGFPVALKAASSRIAHKTEVGGVLLDLRSADEVGAAYDSIGRATRAIVGEEDSSSVVVEQQIAPGFEVVAALHHDELFGHAVMLGVGGTMVELVDLKCFRLAPIDLQDASEMLDEVFSSRIRSESLARRLADVRDSMALKRILVALSQAPAARPDLDSLELNPVIVRGETATAVDVLATVVRRGK